MNIEQCGTGLSLLHQHASSACWVLWVWVKLLKTIQPITTMSHAAGNPEYIYYSILANQCAGFCWAHSGMNHPGVSCMCNNTSTKWKEKECLAGQESLCNWLYSNSGSNTIFCCETPSCQSNPASNKPNRWLKCPACLQQWLLRSSLDCKGIGYLTSDAISPKVNYLRFLLAAFLCSIRGICRQFSRDLNPHLIAYIHHTCWHNYWNFIISDIHQE